MSRKETCLKVSYIFKNSFFLQLSPSSLEIMMRAMGTGCLPLINPRMSATDAEIAEDSMMWVRHLTDWFGKYMDENAPLLTELCIKWSKSVREAKIEEDEALEERNMKRMKLNTALSAVM